MRSSSFKISHFDQAIKSSVSKFGDKRIKEITSLQRKVILGFLKGRDTFCVSPYRLRQIFNLPTSSMSGCWVICCLQLQGYLLYRTSGFSCLSFECPYQGPVIILWETRDQRHQNGRLRVVILRNCLRKPRNLNWKHANSCKCTMGLTSLHYMFMTFLYICCSLFGHSTFSVTSLMFIKGTSCCVIRRNLKWYWAVTMHIVL